ncbi:glycosyl hydrolase family 18 protein [Streptomyces phyllanthi]|uniref:chitinase n=1 Tax=Streptomyces phyllanthi TaxID=1803180 RepID=A0A5N8WGZ7_9ACTN|nr:chitinase [Streptomyces phyllanthi]MPY46730.1 chitinase [Streptomyces phyllanthi]
MPGRRTRTWAGTLATALTTALTAAALGLSGAGQASAADVNNARNPGFESGLTDWTCSAGSGAAVSSPVRSGSAALKATPAGQDNAKCVQMVAVKPTVSGATGYNAYRGALRHRPAKQESTEAPSRGAVGIGRGHTSECANGRTSTSYATHHARPGHLQYSAGLGGYTVNQFKADIRAKQAAGKKVIVSVGGERGTVAVNDATSAANFANSVYSLMQTYGFDGVDIDLENGLNATYMTQALRSLSAKAGPSMVLTMAPQTIDMQSTSNAYFQTALNVKDILTVVNMQYYNSGSMLGCDGRVYSQGSVDFLTALACIQLEGGLSPSQVGLGLPASTRGAGSGYVSPSVVSAALDCLTRGTNCGSFKPSRTYPDLRGAMTWSTNWDALAGNAWSNSVGPKVHGLP